MLADVFGPATKILKQGFYLSNCPNSRGYFCFLFRWRREIPRTLSAPEKLFGQERGGSFARFLLVIESLLHHRVLPV